MTNSLLIRGGRIIDPSQKIDFKGSLLLTDGKVAWLGEDHATHVRSLAAADRNHQVVADRGNRCPESPPTLRILDPHLRRFHCHLRETV